MKTDERIKLEDQLCFSLYAASRLVTKCYQPILDEMGITYPQYLVLTVLWESNAVSLLLLSERLKLQSNTLTPLLQRMQESGLISRVRSKTDERSIVISLTRRGKLLESKVPLLQNQLATHIGISAAEVKQLHHLLNKIISNIGR